MRFNDDSMKVVSRNISSPDKEARLSYKAPKDSYKERWFKLKGNIVFLYRTNDHGAESESEACGLIYLERCKFQMEPMGDRPFVFSGTFQGEGDKKHFFSAQTLQQCHDWITILTQASYENVKAKLHNLQGKILRRTGRDPLPALVDTSCPQLVGKEDKIKSRAKTPPAFSAQDPFKENFSTLERSSSPFRQDTVNSFDQATKGSTFRTYTSSQPARRPTRAAPAVPQKKPTSQPTYPNNVPLMDAPLIDFGDSNVQNVTQINCSIAQNISRQNLQSSNAQRVNPEFDVFAAFSDVQRPKQPVAQAGLPVPRAANTQSNNSSYRERPKSKSPIPDSIVSAFDHLATKAKSINLPNTDKLFSSSSKWEKFDG